MSEFPETSESLIAKVRDPADQKAWERFEEMYRPVIYRIARKRGLQHCDALDLVQQVLISVAAAIGRYERDVASTPFRNWLSRITRNAILKALTRGPSDQAAGGSEVLEVLREIPSTDAETERLIETEYRRELYSRAAGAVRREIEEATWLAFELTVVQTLSVDHAARSLGLSTGSVYAARSRVMRRLRDKVKELELEDDRELSDQENSHAVE